ncbi:MAG TPA: thioredoxin family protein [Clostridiaceae bacterium]|nr:thioredoxin family protein [Clostridiaceae bacterium]
MSKLGRLIRKTIVFGLILIVCITMIGCKSDKNKTDTDDQSQEGASVNQEEKSQDEVMINQADEAGKSNLDQQITPINEIEPVSDLEAANAIVADVSKVNNLDIDSNIKGIMMIVEHDGKLKEVPLQYNLINWLIEQEKPVIIELVADYSPPSQKSLPYLNGIASHYGDKALVMKIDIEQNENLIQDFDIEYLPAYRIAKNKTVYNVENSFDPTAKPSLFDKIEQVLSD